MENRAHALIAGLFTLLLGVAAVLSLLWFGERREETRELVIVTRQNVGGLNLEAQVRYRGIRVGKVLEIALDPKDASRILIRVALAQSIPLTRGTTARLSYQGITGIAHVLLEDNGSDPRPLSDDLPRLVMQPTLFDYLEDTLPVMLAQGRKFLENANAVLDQGNRQHLSGLLTNLESTAARTNATMAQTQKLFSEENVEGLSSAIRQSGLMMQETRRLVTQLHSLSSQIDQLARESIGQDGSGSLSTRLNRMIQELTSASQQLKQVLQQLEDSPQSLVLGAPSGIPGPGEPGFASKERNGQ